MRHVFARPSADRWPVDSRGLVSALWFQAQKQSCATHIWTHPICKGISRLLTRERHGDPRISDLLTRSLASAALMACALFRLTTDGGSRAGVWSGLRRSRSDLSCHQCETLIASVGEMTVMVGGSPSYVWCWGSSSFGVSILHADGLPVGLRPRHERPADARMLMRQGRHGDVPPPPAHERDQPTVPGVWSLGA